MRLKLKPKSGPDSQSYEDADCSKSKWLCLYVVTFVLVLPTLTVYGPCQSSVFYFFRRHVWDPVPSWNKTEKLNVARMKLASEYFESADPDNVRDRLRKLAGDNLDIAIGVVTAPRRGPNPARYLTQTTSRLLSQMTDQSIMSRFSYSVKLIICNGGVNPSNNTHAIGLQKYLDVVNMPTKSAPKIHEDVLEHESTDYAACLAELLKYSSRYLIALEDDAYARDDVWTLLEFVISQKLDHRISRGTTITDSNQVAFVKLLRPDFQLCYFKEGIQDKLELLGASAVLGTVITLLHDYLRKKFYPSRYEQCNSLTLLAWCIYVLLVLFALDRACLVKLRRFFPPHFYIYVPAQKKSTPAILFTPHGAKSYIEYLNRTEIMRNMPKDKAMDDMAVVKQMKGYQLLPSAFSHIGSVSTIRIEDKYKIM